MRHGLAVVLLVVAVVRRGRAAVAAPGVGRAGRSRPRSRVLARNVTPARRARTTLRPLGVAARVRARSRCRSRSCSTTSGSSRSSRAAPRAARRSSARAGCSPAAVVALLNLDAAVVLLTPLYVRTARRVGHRSGDARVPAGAARDARERRAAGVEPHEPHRRVAPLAHEHRLPDATSRCRRSSASTVGWFAYRRVFPARAVIGDEPSGTVDRRALRGRRERDRALPRAAGRAASTSGVPAWVAALVTDRVPRRCSRGALPWRRVPVGTVVLAGCAGGRRGGRRRPRSRMSVRGAGDGGVRGFATGVVVGRRAQQPAGHARDAAAHHARRRTCGRCCSGSTSGPTPRDHRARSRGCCGRRRRVRRVCT